MNALRNFWQNYPLLANWAILAIGMVIILVISAWNVGFLPLQWAALIVATVLLAGLCAWIINWES